MSSSSKYPVVGDLDRGQFRLARSPVLPTEYLIETFDEDYKNQIILGCGLDDIIELRDHCDKLIADASIRRTVETFFRMVEEMFPDLMEFKRSELYRV